MVLTACSGGGGAAPASTAPGKTESTFSYWNEGAEASAKLAEYMKTIYGDGVTKNPDKGLSFYFDYKIP